MNDFYRCCYHLGLGLLVSYAWLFIAEPSHACSGPGNTGTYWFGMYLVLIQLMLRTAVYAQKNLSRLSVDPILVWLRAAIPYLLELLLYSIAATLMMAFGGSDTLTTPRAPTAYDLALLSYFCLGLLPLCSLLLGWKLSQSKLPAWLPLTSAACLCVLVIPSSFQLTEELLPRSFPLLPVCGVAIGGLLFLLLCSRFPGLWLLSREAPHPALGLACVLPGFFTLMMAAGTLETESFPEALAGFLLGAIWVALAACPSYLLVWLLPWRPKGPEMIPYCGALGVLVFYTLVWLGLVAFSPERASWMPPWDWHFLMGTCSALAPACLRERSKDYKQPANKSSNSEL